MNFNYRERLEMALSEIKAAMHLAVDDNELAIDLPRLESIRSRIAGLLGDIPE